MLKDFLWVDSPARMEAHDLIEEIYELGVAYPFVTAVVKAFL